jgi:ribonuclease E
MMLINQTDDECRIAVVENGILQEMLIEHTSSEQIKNNIYKGIVVQIQTSLQAAFVDYGDKKHGFLPNSELNPLLLKNSKHRKNDPIQNKIRVGQELIVQVTREASNHKGSALTTFITLPGRFMVLMPNCDKGGVSKKIDDAQERERLKSFLSGIESEEHAVIIRTAGLGRSLSELKKDYTSLKKTWNEIWTKFENLSSSGLILEETDAVTRTLRDYYNDDIKEVWVDNPETFQKALTFFKDVAPRNQKDLKLFVDERSLFATYNIERQVEQLTSRQVKLKSGGSIVIDQTEALVAIDVNSGRSNQEGNIDSTALRTNIEAADEISRQIRLRNLGGLIVIDFIDMENESYRKQVEDKLAESMRKDKAQLRFNPISQFGLLELSRQRLAVGISSTVEAICPVCNGKGKIPSVQASTNLIIRTIREFAARGNVSKIEGELPLELVNVVLNDRRQSISDLELEFDIDIVLKGNPEIKVFNERFLRPIYKNKSPQPEQQRKDPAKPEPNKKWNKKQNQKKDVPGKKHAKNPHREYHQDKHQPIQEEEQNLIVDTDKPAFVEVQNLDQQPDQESYTIESIQTESESKKESNIGNYGIHPSCLFTNVKELENTELAEITTSFENRLKGKIDNNPPQLIDNKYLWKSQNGKKESEPLLAEPDQENRDKTSEEQVKIEKSRRNRRKNASRARKRAEHKSTENKEIVSQPTDQTAPFSPSKTTAGNYSNPEQSMALENPASAQSVKQQSRQEAGEISRQQPRKKESDRRNNRQEVNTTIEKNKPENTESDTPVATTADKGSATKNQKKKSTGSRRRPSKKTDLTKTDKVKNVDKSDETLEPISLSENKSAQNNTKKVRPKKTRTNRKPTLKPE